MWKDLLMNAALSDLEVSDVRKAATRSLWFLCKFAVGVK